MNKKVLAILKNIFFLAVGIALFYLAFRNVGPDELLTHLKSADYKWVAIALSIALVSHISRAVRWKIIIEPLGYNPSLLNTLYAVFVAYLANMAVPRLGEISRCTVLNQTDNVPLNSLIGTVIVERALDLAILLSLVLTVFIAAHDTLGQFFIDIFGPKIAPFLSFSLTKGLIIGLLAIALIIAFVKLRHKLSQIPGIDKLISLLNGILDGFKTIYTMEKKGWFVFHTVLIWVCYFFVTYCFFFTIPATSHLGLTEGLFTLIVGGLGMSAPVQGGIGVYHIMVQKGLTIFNIAASDGLAFAFIAHTSQTLLLFCTGVISLIMLFISKRKKRNEQPSVSKV